MKKLATILVGAALGLSGHREQARSALIFQIAQERAKGARVGCGQGVYPVGRDQQSQPVCCKSLLARDVRPGRRHGGKDPAQGVNYLRRVVLPGQRRKGRLDERDDGEEVVVLWPGRQDGMAACEFRVLMNA